MIGKFESCPLIYLFFILSQLIISLLLAAQEVPAETEPKFSPFTGAARRLDGKPLKHQPQPVSSPASKDKQAVVADGSRQPSMGSSSQNTARQSQGKLVFGSNVSRASKETQKVLFLLSCIILNLLADHHPANEKTTCTIELLTNWYFDLAGIWKRD